MLNLQHSHLKFTIENTTEALSFLEVEIKNFGNGIEHLVYCKQPNAMLILNYHADCPDLKVWINNVSVTQGKVNLFEGNPV